MDAIAQRKEESLEFKERAVAALGCGLSSSVPSHPLLCLFPQERAIEAFNVQNFKRAEQHLSSAIELDPENHVFYSNRAAAYMAMETFEQALRA